jgi:hypothetical protein
VITGKRWWVDQRCHALIQLLEKQYGRRLMVFAAETVEDAAGALGFARPAAGVGSAEEEAEYKAKLEEAHEAGNVAAELEEDEEDEEGEEGEEGGGGGASAEGVTRPGDGRILLVVPASPLLRDRGDTKHVAVEDLGRGFDVVGDGGRAALTSFLDQHAMAPQQSYKDLQLADLVTSSMADPSFCVHGATVCVLLFLVAGDGPSGISERQSSVMQVGGHAGCACGCDVTAGGGCSVRGSCC